MGEYIPQAPINDEAKKHNENLPGMGRIYNTVNFHLYHYAGNNPIRYTDPTGRVTDDELAAGNTILQKGAIKNKLSDLVNIKKLAEIITNNATELDDKTGAYVMRLGSTQEERAAAVEKILGEVTVYSDIGEKKLNDVISKFIPSMPARDIDGLTVGNNIYLKDSAVPMDSRVANLLGHEAIHTLQVAAFGGTTQFMNAYLSNFKESGYSEKNTFEYAAYVFGGNSGAANIVLSFPQILPSKNGWWR